MTKSFKPLLKFAAAGSIMALLWFFSSCSNKDRVPDGILTRGEMVNVLSEIYIREQVTSTLGLKRDSLKQIFGVMKDSIFSHAGTTDSVFRKSMNYYMDRPETLEGIYTVLIDSLNLREQRMLSSEGTK